MVVLGRDEDKASAGAIACATSDAAGPCCPLIDGASLGWTVEDFVDWLLESLIAMLVKGCEVG